MDLNSLVAQINNRFAAIAPNSRARSADGPGRRLGIFGDRPGLIIRPRDSFVPSSRLTNTITPNAIPSGDTYTPQATAPTEEAATYSFLRQARLDYKLGLNFDLGAVTHLAQSYANGDLESMEEFAAAGFGFSGDFHISGQQLIEEVGGDPSGDSLRREFSMHSMERSGIKAYQDRSFGAQSFYRESMRTRHALHESVHDGHHKAVNSLDIRYKLDNRFQMSFLNRFDQQTQSMNDSSPEQLPDYFNSVDGLAQKGSSNMMATFFDAVDTYLDGAEEKMLAQATRAFEHAAAELGFDGAAVETVKDQMSATIGGFFNRVDQALEQVESTFVAPEPVAAPTLLATVPPPQNLGDLYNPALELLRSFLASG